MGFEIEYTAKVLKYLESLEPKDATRLFNKVESIKDNPLHFAEKLVSVNLWKLRIGDYRAILHINKARGIISVLDIGHRKKVYRKL